MSDVVILHPGSRIVYRGSPDAPLISPAERRHRRLRLADYAVRAFVAFMLGLMASVVLQSIALIWTGHLFLRAIGS